MVCVEIDDSGPLLGITVTDHAGAGDSDDETIALALVRGLADTLSVGDGPGGEGGSVWMSWRQKNA